MFDFFQLGTANLEFPRSLLDVSKDLSNSQLFLKLSMLSPSFPGTERLSEDHQDAAAQPGVPDAPGFRTRLLGMHFASHVEISMNWGPVLRSLPIVLGPYQVPLIFANSHVEVETFSWSPCLFAAVVGVGVVAIRSFHPDGLWVEDIMFLSDGGKGCSVAIFHLISESTMTLRFKLPWLFCCYLLAALLL